MATCLVWDAQELDGVPAYVALGKIPELLSVLRRKKDVAQCDVHVFVAGNKHAVVGFAVLELHHLAQV